ncbi:hypothetical protein [Dactylosporangium darangshiense]|uniref:Uncharacterized protein n=1 Tax=Dactylosporangium darangshiense TaxID=579108 RepID=A0ABP8DKU2_9ACTN
MTTTTQTGKRTRPQALAASSAAQTATRRRGMAQKAAGPGRTEPTTTASARSASKPDQRAGRTAGRAKALPAHAEAAPETELVTWQDVRMPNLKVPVFHVPQNVQSRIANVRWTGRTVTSAIPMPQPKQLLYYGGVGALAALGVLEWPVAVAAAAGVWVATHSRRTAATAG